MPVPLLAALTPLLIKAVTACVCVGGTCYCVKKAHDAFKTGQNTKRLKYKNQVELNEAKRLAQEDNKTARTEETKQKQSLEEVNNKLEKRSEEIQKLKNELKNP